FVANARAQPPPSYTLSEDISGDSFFDHFVFVTDPDASKGFVKYVDRATATKLGLISTAGGHAKISVDSAHVAVDPGRESVRLSSIKETTTGLFILDVDHIPEGAGTWPAFWSFGAHWPNNGEIDVIEGVNSGNSNQSTIHTRAGCTMPEGDSSRTMTGTYSGHDCGSGDACSVRGVRGSFGPSFNAAGGGVYATLWKNSGISVWFFPRGSIPADISAGHPNPRKWGLPVAFFPLGSDCPAADFSAHHIVINTDLCGDWAGTHFIGFTGIGRAACARFVRDNPAAFKEAYWEIRYLRIYTLP
ncbi:MAG: glycoside hydrolase family 16 protein, partial [Bdellovibrionota bacterium]